MSDLLTESQALRACNLPATQNWRDWLRSKLPSQEISTGRIYDRGLVDHLAAKIRPINSDIVLPPEERTAPEPVRVGFSGATDSGIRPKNS